MFCIQITKHIPSVLSKLFSTSASRPAGIKWRQANGYPDNPTSRGVLTDGPDYTYLDGTPTPYTTGQRARIIKQQEYAERVQKLLSVIGNSKQRYQEKVADEQKERDKILGRKLRPKGRVLKNSSL